MVRKIGLGYLMITDRDFLCNSLDEVFSTAGYCGDRCLLPSLLGGHDHQRKVALSRLRIGRQI